MMTPLARLTRLSAGALSLPPSQWSRLLAGPPIEIGCRPAQQRERTFFVRRASRSAASFGAPFDLFEAPFAGAK